MNEKTKFFLSGAAMALVVLIFGVAIGLMVHKQLAREADAGIGQTTISADATQVTTSTPTNLVFETASGTSLTATTVLSPSLGNVVSSTLSGATTTIMTNNSDDRLILSAHALFPAGTNIGSFDFIVGTSTNGYATPTSPLIATRISRLSGITEFSTTSTAQTSPYLWKKGEDLPVKMGTTTESGATIWVTYVGR